MKEIMNAYSNWRVLALAFAAAIALLLVTSTSEGMMPQVMGMALAAAAYLVGRRWHKEGKLKELDDIRE